VIDVNYGSKSDFDALLEAGLYSYFIRMLAFRY
jgi:hypothetical protein